MEYFAGNTFIWDRRPCRKRFLPGYAIASAGTIIEQLFREEEGLVGAARFELATPCAQGRCATRLRYAPTMQQLA
jgi:hypothetical protein